MNYIDELVTRYPILEVCKESIAKTADIMTESFRRGGKLLVAGNGGSAADSDHITGELLKSFVKKRKLSETLKSNLESNFGEIGSYLSKTLEGSLPAIPLTTHTAANTATINDTDATVMFAEQIVGLGVKGDVFLGISTSGNSKNIVYAAVTARAKGLEVVALTGRDGGKLKGLSSVSIIVPLEKTYQIQELHLPIYHALCLEIEERLF